jgi:hypothetical protein
MQMIRRSTAIAPIVVLLLAASAGCAPTSRPKSETSLSAHGGPADPFARESHGLSSSTVTSSDGVVLLQTESSGEPEIHSADGAYALTVPIGSAAPIKCSIHPDVEPVAVAIAGIYASLGAEPAERRLLAIEPVVLLDRPALYVEVGTVKHTTEGTLVSTGKIEAFTIGGGGTAWCSHPENGYRETFRRVVAGIAGTLRLSVEGSPLLRAVPKVQQISVQRIGTTPLGVSEQREYLMENGGTVVLDRSLQVVPRGNPPVLAARDYSEIEVSGTDGIVTLADALVVTTQDGSAVERHQWRLERAAGGRYHVIDVTAGKGQAQQPVADARPLPGSRQRRDLIRTEILSGQRASLSVPIWDPSLAPTGWQDPTYRLLSPSESGERRVERTLATDKRILFYDASGCWVRSEPADPTIPTGYSERVFQRGSCSAD